MLDLRAYMRILINKLGVLLFANILEKKRKKKQETDAKMNDTQRKSNAIFM